MNYQNVSQVAGKVALGISVAILAFVAVASIVERSKWHQDYSLSLQSFISIEPRNGTVDMEKRVLENRLMRQESELQVLREVQHAAIHSQKLNN
jgi:hypothetical protein